MMRPRTFLPLAALAAAVGLAPALAAEPPAIPRDQLEAIHKTIKRQPGEWKWAEVEWLLSVREAQKKAAVEGRPLLIVTAAQGCLAGTV